MGKKKKKSEKKGQKCAEVMQEAIAIERQRMLAEVEHERANVMLATDAERSRILAEAHTEADRITRAARDAAHLAATRAEREPDR